MIVDMLIVQLCIKTYKEQSKKFIHLQKPTIRVFWYKGMSSVSWVLSGLLGAQTS